MTSSPVANAANIEQPKANPNTGNGRKLMMPWHIGQFDISSNAFRVIVFIISAYGDDGLIKFKRATLAACCHISTQVLDRVLIELKGAGLIRYRSTGRCLQFWLTDLCWPGANKPRPVESENHYQQRNRVITGNETPNIGMKRNIRNEKKIQQLPPKQAHDHPSNVRPLHQAKPVLFSDKQIKKMGDYAEQIESACRDILDFPSRPGVTFNPMQAVGQSLKKNKQPGAIAETLIGMARYWKTIEIPWKIYESQLKIKNQNWNARQTEIESELFKKLFD